MPIVKIPIKHYLGIVSQSQQEDFKKRFRERAEESDTARNTTSVRRNPFETTEGFIDKYNQAHGSKEQEKYENLADVFLSRCKRRAGFTSVGEGKHVDLPAAWTQLLLLSLSNGKVRNDSLDVLVMSLDHAPIHADQIPGLFHLAESIHYFLCSDTTLSDPPSSYKTKMLQLGYLVSLRLFIFQLTGLLKCETRYKEFPNMLFSVHFMLRVGEVLCGLKLTEDTSVQFSVEAQKRGVNQVLRQCLLGYHCVQNNGIQLSQVIKQLMLLSDKLQQNNWVDCGLGLMILGEAAKSSMLCLQTLMNLHMVQTQESTQEITSQKASWPWQLEHIYCSILIDICQNSYYAEIKKTALIGQSINSSCRRSGGLVTLLKQSHEDKWRLRYSVVQGLAQISRRITLPESLRNTSWLTLQKHLNQETDLRIINAVRIIENSDHLCIITRATFKQATLNHSLSGLAPTPDCYLPLLTCGLLTKDQTVMQSSPDTGWDRTADPFTALVQAVRSSLMQNANPSPPAASTTVQPSPSPAAPITSSATSASPMARPATYSGAAEDCSGFLLQCSLYMEANSHLFLNERGRVAFIISLLSGRALQWAQSLWESNAPVTGSVSAFCSHLKEVFGQHAAELSVQDQLFNIRQGRRETASSYALRFRTLACISGWNEAALISAFRHGLRDEVKQLIVVYEDSMGLELLIQKTVRMSQRLSACGNTAPATNPLPVQPSVAPPAPEFMQIDTHHLTTMERQRRIHQQLCLYCGGDGHGISTCPVRPPRPAVSAIQLPPHTAHLTKTLVYVKSSHSSISAQALIDSGSAGNFISQQTLQRLNARRQRCPVDLRITTIQGRPLGRGRVRHFSPTLTLRIGHLHEETITFMVLEESTADIILGRPWLNLHQPHLHWSSGEILKWGENCFHNCITRPIKVRPKSSPVHQQLPVQSTSVESPDTHINVTIPPAYRAFQDVFSKRLATKLPPHRPWDCAIDLLPGATLPKGRIYPLSIPEQQAMEEYVHEALQQGFIRPSTSPAASSFFFVAKKDGGLRSCIDYRHLNSQTIKFSYPLPLVPAALEQLRGATIFSKLDLRSAYNLIRIRKGDEWKTAFITPSGHYEYRVMPYGLSNSVVLNSSPRDPLLCTFCMSLLPDTLSSGHGVSPNELMI
ncbi:Transmembrane protein 232 [Anabarilius grahami]|uniref:Transmembrane protein 232 n=1 Tax=Anabarilius grahami TaxID=495550 RepID=A0A3N0XXR5_ANAGA|nr:Transmembrane protein 232 [Anabarilius grahami]